MLRDQNIYWHIRRSETIPSINESIRNNADCFEINFISGEAVNPATRKSQHLNGKRAIDSFDYEDTSVYSINFPSYEFAHICGNSYFMTATNKKGGNTNFDKKVIFPKCKLLRGWIKFDNRSDERFIKIVEWSSLPKIAKKEYQRSKNNEEELKEWFKNYIYTILREDVNYIKNNISGTSQKVDLKLRNPQQNAVDIMLEYFIKDPKKKKEFLLGAIQRFGKNVTWLSVIQLLYEKGFLKYNNIAVLTYRPWVFSSLKEDVEKFSQFKDFNYINIAFDRDLTTLQKNKVNIITSSVQLLLSDTKTDKADDENLTNEETELVLNKLNKLSNIKLDFVIVDEYHFGCTRTHNNETSNFGKILNCLDYHNKIWISGTPFYDLYKGTFSSDQKFIYDQLDEYNDMKELCKNNKYAICKLKLVYYSSKTLTDIYTKYKTELEKEDLPLIDKVYNNRLIVKEFLSKIFDYNDIENHISSAYSIFDENFFKINENGKTINTVMCNCGRIDRANLTSLLLNEIFGNNIHIIKWYGNYNIDIEDLISQVKYYNKKNEPCIILSCGKGFEGISVPGIHAVLHFCTSHSAIQYFQFGYRGKTPDIENEKEYCYIIDFDLNRMLEMYHELAVCCCNNRNDSNITTVIEELLKAMPFICRNETTKVYSEFNLENFWKNYRNTIENRNYKDYLQQDIDINTFINFAKDNKYINDILEAIKIATKGKAKITKQQLTNTPELAGGKKSKRIKAVAPNVDKKKKNPHEEDKTDTKIEKYFNELIQFILQKYFNYCKQEITIWGETDHCGCKNHLMNDIKNGQDFFNGIKFDVIKKIFEFFNSNKIDEKLSTFNN